MKILLRYHIPLTDSRHQIIQQANNLVDILRRSLDCETIITSHQASDETRLDNTKSYIILTEQQSLIDSLEQSSERFFLS